VIDIQDPERFDDSLGYLNSILTFFSESKMDVPIIITFHKFDPKLKANEEILANIEKLREKILDEYPEFNILFQQSSIYDIISIVQLVSYGLSVFDKKFFELSELLEYYIDLFENQALIVFDHNGIIISEYYNDIEPDVYIELIESIKEHLFLLKRMEEEKYEGNFDFTSSEGMLFSYLLKFSIKSETFFVSALLEADQKINFFEKFPNFLDDIKKILSQLM
ncbi:MAG: hypothetical protein ACFFC3_13935, partial [Candidatus Odinarchaeota archaeon]